MKTIEFLSYLRSLDVKLWVDGDKLRYSAPSGTLAPALRAELAKRKAEIFMFLGKTSVNTPPILSVSRDRDLPLSFAQQRLWFLDQLEPDSPAYNIPAAIRLTGPLNVAALEQSLNEIVQRHEILRTTFSLVEGQPVQVIAPTLTLTLPVVDLTNLPETERETEARRLATKEAQQPFDLARGPLLRATLLRPDEEDHVLLLTMHHIVSDGWSMGVLYRELSALYEAFSKGKPSPLPELPIQYADFAVWQRQWLQGGDLEAQLSHWKKQLAGFPPSLDLPTDRPRPAIQTHRGARQSLVLPKTLSDSLKALSRQEGTTLFMTLLAAFQTLLYRYTGQDDIIVGSPIANRNRVEIERLIGFFVNTLVLRTDLSDNPTFRELLGRVREVALGAYAHQDLPFEKLVEALQPGRNLSHSPLFQVMFAFQNVPRQALELSGLTARPLEVDSGTAKFDLALSIVEKAEGLKAASEYNTDLFDAATITRMLGHYQTLLEGILADPEQQIGTLPLLTEAERHQLLVEWNDAQTDYPEDLCIHQLFEEGAERTPDEIAVFFEEQQITYKALNTRANQLAHHLIKQGVGPEVMVGICMERSLEMIVGILGILKAGGAYVPLEPAYPKERLAFMLDDSHSLVLLTQEEFQEQLPDLEIPILYWDTVWNEITQESKKNPDCGVSSRNLAYVFYTSGSTGKPKGVMISHQNVVGFLYAYKQVTLDGPRRIGTSVAPFNFDTSVEEIFSTLCFGGTLHIIRPENSTNVEYFANYLVDHQITTTYILPDFLYGVASHLEKVRGRMNLKCVITGLAPKKESALQSMRDLSDQIRILNAYGPTEVTYGATAFDFQFSTDPDRDAPIGVPFPNYEVYIVDAYLQPVPIGVTGELLIGGVGLARGYLNHPELTAEKFISHPFSDKPGARVYRTGDLARFLPDGNIEFLGRSDHQVKIRGFRIELGEIETVLERHPAVEKTVVLAREDRPGDKRLVAYVVPGQGATPTINILRSFLEKKLPNYMIPSIFVFIDALPLMPNGKIDRQALPAPDIARPELEETFVAPRDELELQLTKIWEQLLGLQPIGVRDNFFNLGGHSLLAVRLLAQIEKTFDKDLPLVTLFQAPTIEQLASILRQEGWSASWSSLVAIQPGGSKRPFFCVPGILGNVFSDLGDLARHLGPDQPFYGLQDGIQNPSQIEALAAHYVDEIRTVQPEGPYLLGGVCSGGVVAFEMAQQLQAQGQKVALLALVEPSRPPVPGLRAYLKFIASVLRRVVQRSGHHSRNLVQRSSAEWGTYARLKAKLVANSWALRRYAPQPYPGRIALFLANESLAESPQDPRLDWRELAAGGAEIHIVPGSHDTITRTHDAIPEEPHLQVLAEQLRVCIDDVLTDDNNS